MQRRKFRKQNILWQQKLQSDVKYRIFLFTPLPKMVHCTQFFSHISSMKMCMFKANVFQKFKLNWKCLVFIKICKLITNFKFFYWILGRYRPGKLRMHHLMTRIPFFFFNLKNKLKFWSRNYSSIFLAVSGIERSIRNKKKLSDQQNLYTTCHLITTYVRFMRSEILRSSYTQLSLMNV